MRKIIVGSRRSKLAITQTNWVIDQLKKSGMPFEFEVKEIVTKGDIILDVTLSKVGGKGLFVKEIEQAMLDKEIDIAVHSMKDMPSELPEGLEIGCTPKRVDPRDALISEKYSSLRELPAGAIVGTSSLRRAAQVLNRRPDLTIKSIRGNIDTRLNKLKSGEFDAIILAAAGLERMGWSTDVVTEYLDIDLCLPAVGQGSLAIECRSEDLEVKELLATLNDAYTFDTVLAERSFLNTLEGGCQVPIAAFATMDENQEVSLTGLVADPEGKTVLKEMKSGKDPHRVGVELAEELKVLGAKTILDAVKKDLNT
ncbi:hydroxymethylbilane synthase [Fictibacillus sp. 5RED26]|uniref:hydroxymethylbilane synthase n=1 Tax=Fictibacillus TaxID=1329200 RepID=UPI0018CE77FD|nr:MULTISPECIES: hydroxymethylbilane synthase [unclassified Fictibacillus]MBH0157729.1 hydroxymethylbilane synthase [Fictibacillus sp. 5RED26]MBH0163331.1 hydroxymethylbilane synthase [Fictibacillus sp. 7GRE50]MBH0175125.1 hydroxymethylbilane synthase [Fictibacillus sp. 23RED33]